MKRTYVTVLAAMLCLMLSGCAFWQQGTYISVKPYHVQDVGTEYEMIVANSHNEVLEALEVMVADCVQAAIISVPELDESAIDNFMSAAINQLVRNNAMAAYAVEQISYEVGTNGGDLAIAVDISYRYNRVNILRIKRLENTQSAVAEMELALQQYEPEITVYISDYVETDFLQLAQDYVDKNPQLCMEMPQVTVTAYPESGQERVLVLTFTYWNSREVLRSMQENVLDVFRQLNVTGDSVQQRAAGVYGFLTNLHNYEEETSITPSYSLLRYGIGDSKAFATIYAAMCREKGIDCQVVSGSRGGEAWYWNVVNDNGKLYYVDILRCYKGNGFALLQEQEMIGYVWDYSAYKSE